MAEGVRELDLRLSEKSVLLPSSSEEVKAIVRGLRRAGVKIKGAAIGEDVGVEAAAGTRRTARTVDGRIAKGRKRADRVGHLCKKVKWAAKLGTTGVQPAHMYGHQAVGASRRQVNAMRRNLKAASHLGPTKGCVATVIRWVHGENVDPLVTVRLQQLDEWFHIWEGSDVAERRQLRKHWRKVMPELVACSDRWSMSSGPVAATICTLAQVGCRPAAPDRWMSPRGSMALVSFTPHAKSLIREEVRQDLEALAANEAAEHANGRGIGDRILLGPARAAKRYFIKNKRWKEAAAVDHLVIGSLLGPAPKPDGSYRNESYCVRCGKRRVATRLHTLWLCEGNRAIDDPLVKDGDYLIKAAIEG